MGKERVAIPKAVRDSVLGEYRHRCAICSGDKPQLHHIDENPTNNDPLNLIPLCPNCHLRDQHDPTRGIEPEKLRLFRKFRDPTVLSPRFHPLFARTQFIKEVSSSSDINDLHVKAQELIEFVGALEMGEFYAKRLSELISRRRVGRIYILGSPESDRRYEKDREEEQQQYRDQLMQSYGPVCRLVVELLPYQGWANTL